MRITKHEADKSGNIRIDNAVMLLTMGIRNNIVTIWAATDPLGASGLPTIPLSFIVKKDGDEVSQSQVVAKRYITSFINDKGVWHLFAGDPPKVMPAHVADKLPGNPTHNPAG